jgi:hypothetical protein
MVCAAATPDAAMPTATQAAIFAIRIIDLPFAGTRSED